MPTEGQLLCRCTFLVTALAVVFEIISVNGEAEMTIGFLSSN